MKDFRQELEDGERRQEGVLSGIREQNTMYLDSRRVDPSVKAREHALQSLDLAYHKYREIHKNLDGGDQGMLPVVHTGQRLTLCNDSSTMTLQRF